MYIITRKLDTKENNPLRSNLCNEFYSMVGNILWNRIWNNAIPSINLITLLKPTV